MPEIIMSFNEKGDATIEVDGVEGTACTEITSALEEAIGMTEAQRLEKPEFLVPMDQELEIR